MSYQESKMDVEEGKSTTPRSSNFREKMRQQMSYVANVEGGGDGSGGSGVGMDLDGHMAFRIQNCKSRPVAPSNRNSRSDKCRRRRAVNFDVQSDKSGLIASRFVDSRKLTVV